MNVFFALLAPIGLLVLVIRPLQSVASDLVASVVPFYVLVVGMMPAVGAVGIAAGQFAGEKERSVLTPLLAAPVSNLAIFAGKVLGSTLPPVLYSAVAEAIYIAGLAILLGPSGLSVLSLPLIIALVLLVPAATCLAAIVGALVSSRVRTFNSAQQISGILLVPLWAALFAMAFQLQTWGTPGLVATVSGVILMDAFLAILAARTWQREEILSLQ
jgi:ABC-type Na+ efflux pump permease subunit